MTHEGHFITLKVRPTKITVTEARKRKQRNTRSSHTHSWGESSAHSDRDDRTLLVMRGAAVLPNKGLLDPEFGSGMNRGTGDTLADRHRHILSSSDLPIFFVFAFARSLRKVCFTTWSGPQCLISGVGISNCAAITGTDV